MGDVVFVDFRRKRIVAVGSQACGRDIGKASNLPITSFVDRFSTSKEWHSLLREPPRPAPA